MRKANQIVSLVIKILALIFIIAVGVIVYQTCAGGHIIQRIDTKAPDIATAPFEVPTVTKLYYAQQAVLNDDGSVTMTGWYERDNKKWILHKESTTLPKKLRPSVNRR